MKRIIGIDYGSRRVGVAVSDDGHSFAFPRAVYPNDDTLLDRIASLAEEEGAELCVVGESDNPAGGENTIQRRIAIFSEALSVRTGLSVAFVSEAYSSAEARRALEQKTKTRSNSIEPVDAAAAAIILQKYLDHTKQNSASH